MDLSQSPSVPDNDKIAIPSNLDFPVVGVGASAGGLQALLRFFEGMPADNGMAFVVILHLSPKHPSNASEILQRATAMPVLEVVKPTHIKKNHVYVISPSKQLSMNDGYLRVANLERPVGKHIAIDLFFRTLADVHKERSIAIILSGTGADGAVGVARVKEQGGVTVAQNPEDAEYDSMPMAAIGTGVVDFVLPVGEMPQKLIELWRNAQVIRLPIVGDGDKPVVPGETTAANQGAEEALQEVITILRARTGHDFRHYKRATVLRRIERRLQVRALPDLISYRDVLKTDVDESTALLKDMLIGVTNFFRDREAFEALERDVIPQLFSSKKSTNQVRTWVTACSTGEEAYSIAILLAEQHSLLPMPPEIQVFASDIDEQAISVARTGLYPGSIITDVAPSRLRENFSKEESRFRIRQIIRDKVLFAAHNLLRDPPFSRLDLISCRNLLIYLDREVQSQILEMFHFALNPGGFLFLGTSESTEVLADYFTPVDKKNRIYRAKALSRSSRFTPSSPNMRFTQNPVTSTGKPFEKRKFSYAEVHQRVLAQHAPPSVVVNYNLEIMHMSDRAGQFLRYVGGEPSRNLVSLVRPELRLELRTALFKAMQSGKSVEGRRIHVKRDNRIFYVNMTARPFHDQDAAADFVLVLFDEIEEAMDEQSLTLSETHDQNPVLIRLEEELHRTKEHLQNTIEHSESSTEELKASNEELQAINEELRSATEELETSKEELQSVNEELITVNYELKTKVEETGKINDDLNNLIASTDIATVFVDRSMRIKRYTPRATEIFNILPSDIGRSLYDITHRLDYEQLADDAANTFETLRIVEREVRSSDDLVYIAQLLPYRTTESRIDGAVLTFINITGLRQAEEKLRVGEERMRLVAESTKDYAIITLDTAGLISSFNKGAERIFGYTEKEVLGKMGDIIYLQEDRENKIPEEERRRAREEGRAEDERWHLRKDGSTLYCSGVMTPLIDGEFYGYAKIARDLTGRMNVQNQREAQLTREQVSRAEAQAANALKDEFLAIMSHELKHPLNLIHMSAELLSRLPQIRNVPAAMNAAETILSSAASQAKIINDLLDLSRFNTGKLILTLSEVNLSSVVNTIVDVVKADPATTQLTFMVDVPQTPILIRADRVRVEQVIWNLLNNAIKFTTPGGTITIRVSPEDMSARMEVSDTGEGIDAGFLPKVFDMFGQASLNTTRTKGGLGIGLALVQQIVALHNGRVEAASKGVGHGAQFTVWWPMQHASSASPSTQLHESQSFIAGLSILLVDDRKDAVAMLRMLLELYGATVHSTTNGLDALKLLSNQHVDLLLSDIGMPVMDGYAFIKEVRKLPGYAKLPAIAVTGFGQLKDIQRAYEAGFSAHISKPISIDALVEVAMKLQLRRPPGNIPAA